MLVVVRSLKARYPQLHSIEKTEERDTGQRDTEKEGRRKENKEAGEGRDNESENDKHIKEKRERKIHGDTTLRSTIHVFVGSGCISFATPLYYSLFIIRDSPDCIGGRSSTPSLHPSRKPPGRGNGSDGCFPGRGGGGSTDRDELGGAGTQLLLALRSHSIIYHVSYRRSIVSTPTGDFFFFILRRIGKYKALAHHTSTLYASCVDLTQLLSQPNASWRTLRIPL